MIYMHERYKIINPVRPTSFEIHVLKPDLADKLKNNPSLFDYHGFQDSKD